MKRNIALTIVMMTAFIMNLSAKTFDIPSESTSDSSRKTVEATMFVNPFHGINIDMVASVRFVQGPQSRIEAQGPEHIIRLIDVQVKNDVLVMTARDDFKLKKGEKLSLTIYSPELTSLEQNGVGSFKIDTRLETPALKIVSTGVGNICMTDLHCQELHLELDGVGSVELKGEAQKVTYKSNGVGSIDAYEMLAQVAKVDLDGVGSIHCYASQRIDCFNNGVGSIFYKGNPEVENVHKEGIGSIKKR